MKSLHRLLLLAPLLSLAACDLPRGGPVRSEVIMAETNEEGEAVRDFAVYTVTKDALPQLKSWPLTGPHRITSWIRHAPSGGDALIQPGDEIDLVVWDSQDNSLLTNPAERLVSLKDMRVSASGHIFVPYIGRLRVAGQSPEAARRVIQSRMEDVVAAAQVQLSVAEGQQNSFSLVSGVTRPGVYPLASQHQTVLEAISAGGGISNNLRNPQIRLIRSGKTFGISAKKLYDTPELDTVLRGRDKIVVQADDRYFRALGAARNEQLIYFEDDHITALDAMSMMGGLTDNRANPQGILILREYQPGHLGDGSTGPTHERVVFALDLTNADGLFSAGQFHVHPRDTVLVTESPLAVAISVASLARIVDLLFQ